MDSIDSLAGELIDLADPEALLNSAPLPYSPFRDLLTEYDGVRQKLVEMSAYLDDKLPLLQIFLDGNVEEAHHRSATRQANTLFGLAGAIAALNSRFWSRALELTGLRDSFPAPRRAEWETMLRENTCPDFEAETLKATIDYLFSMQGHFLSERVDAVFRGLSRTHVTNEPQGFGKRMILSRAYSEYGKYPEWSVANLITDLRRVIATFMGRPEPCHNSTGTIMRLALSKAGKWLEADGGAFRIRAYRGIGTAHLEVAPEMAWRLNALLANLYPQAIPESFRTRPAKTKRASEWGRIHRPLPTPVLAVIAALDWNRHARDWRFAAPRDAAQIAAMDEARAILVGIGGVLNANKTAITFPFEAGEVIAEIVATGMVPDHVSFQYFPTERPLADRVAALADVQPGMSVLEPSAGQGGLAELLPKDQTTCVEVAALNAAVLRAKGFETLETDFLAWSVGPGRGRRFDRIVMNPPYRAGQALTHLEAAWTHVAPGGRLVAVLPASLAGKTRLEGASQTWSEAIFGAFPGVSIAVVLLTADRPAL